MTSFLLMRHAQSEWNEQGQWQGQADPPLSEQGREQARAAARQVEGFAAVVSSGLARAAETARIIADEIGFEDVHVDDDFNERDVGPWSGLTRAEIESRFPGYLEARRRPEGYEPDDALLRRAIDAVDRLLDAFSGETVLVVTHGGVIYTVERHLGAEWEHLPNLGARWVHSDGGDLALGPRTLLLDENARVTPAERA